MAKGDLYSGSMAPFRARPFNCEAHLGTKERCPRCGQFHSRPGYCQALDPQKSAIDAAGPAWIKKRAAELRAFYANIDSVSDDESETLTPKNETLIPETETLIPSETLKTETLIPNDDLSVSLVPINYCEVCGEGFEAKRKTAKYCSAACRLKAHRIEGG